MSHRLKQIAALTLLFFYVEKGYGVEFQKLGTAVSKALSGSRQIASTSKAFKTTVDVNGNSITAFYTKDPAGKPSNFAFVQKGMYQSDCSHTWVVGVDAKTAKVQGIEVVEMSCPHAFPTNKASFLDQYKGKGPADLKELKGNIHTIAKATASCDLTTDAVSRSIEGALKLRGKI